MAINIIMPSINNFLNSFSNGLPGMKDYRHASRLYLDDNFKLLPKQKFLFHTVFSIDNTIPFRAFTNNEQLELNMLVKNADLPKFDITYVSFHSLPFCCCVWRLPDASRLVKIESMKIVDKFFRKMRNRKNQKENLIMEKWKKEMEIQKGEKRRNENREGEE